MQRWPLSKLGTMPINEESRRPLHDVMIETMLGLREELNQHQRDLVFEAADS
jgi:hypothetical protein